MTTMTTTPAQIIKPLNWLIGKWRSVCASGKYPTIKPFDYVEEFEFTFEGQPLLNYKSRTYSLDKQPKHFENGFLRIKPGTNEVSFLIAHNFGLTSREEGEINNCEMIIKSTNIARMQFAKDPAVCKIERHYKMIGDRLEMVMKMETSKTPLTEHLRAVYEKISD